MSDPRERFSPSPTRRALPEETVTNHRVRPHHTNRNSPAGSKPRQTQGSRPWPRSTEQAAAPQPPTRKSALSVTRTLGAVALVVVGSVDFEQYTVVHFSAIPT